jgi:hypothetical protein
MSKRVVIYCLLALLMLTTAWLRLGLGPGVNIVNYRRIEQGMSAKEVEDLLGGDDGSVLRGGSPIYVPNQGWIERWGGTGGSITLVYDVNGRVVEKEWDWNDRKRSFLDDLLRIPQVRE